MNPSTFENDLKCTSPERNRLQNCFLDTEFQKLVVKKCAYIENDLPLPDINRLYETEFYQKCMNGKRFTLDTDIDIEFNPDSFWDVKMTHFYTGHVIECSFFDMDVVNYHKQSLQEKLNTEKITIYAYKNGPNGPTIGFKLKHLAESKSKIRCLIRPTLGDNYPSVLCSMNTSDDDDNDDAFIYHVLLVEHFTAAYTSKEQLIQIFKYSNIDVLFYNDLIGYNSLQET